MVAYSALALVAANVVRQHNLTPLRTTNANVPATAWIYSQRWTKNGNLAFTSWRDAPNALLQQCRVLPGRGPRQAIQDRPSRNVSPSTATSS